MITQLCFTTDLLRKWREIFQSIDLIHDTRHLCTRKDWWDKSNVTWFVRGQASDKRCQCKKSRASLFILDNRIWNFYLSTFMLNTLTLFKKNRAVFYEATWSKTREHKVNYVLSRVSNLPWKTHDIKKNTYPYTSSHLDLFFNTHHSYIVILLANLLALCYKSKNNCSFSTVNSLLSPG